MKVVPILAFATLAFVSYDTRAAEPVQPSFQASPESYKILGENEDFIVIQTTRAPGNRDQWHSHKAAAVYWLTDCDQKLYTPDGKTADSKFPAGYVRLQPPIESHSTENVGTAECRQIIVEKK